MARVLIGWTDAHYMADGAGNAIPNVVLDVQVLGTGAAVTDLQPPTEYAGQAFPTGQARSDAAGYYGFTVPEGTPPVRVRAAARVASGKTVPAGSWVTPSGQVLVDGPVKAAVAALEAALPLTYVGAVLPQKFGAKGDGVRDDTAAIQAAINYVATNGGYVYLPAGVYRITSTLRLLSYVRVVGAGRHATVIRVADGSDCDAIKSEDYDTLAGTLSPNGLVASSLEHLAIDGNRGNNASGDGLKLYGCDYHLNGVVVHSMAGRGIVTDWSPDAEPATASLASEARLTDFKVLRCGGNGIEWNGPHDSQISRGVVALCNQDGAADGVGFWLKPRSSASQVSDVHVWGTSMPDAWRVEGSAYLIDCIGDGATARSLHILNPDVTVIGGHYFVNPEQSPNAKGIVLGDASHPGIGGCYIATKVSNCAVAALDATYAGQYNHISIVDYQTSGSAMIGSLDSTNELRLIVNGLGGAEAGYRFPAQTTIYAQSATAFLVRSATTNAFNVNTQSNRVEIVQGAELCGYEDNFGTKRWKIASNSGAISAGAYATSGRPSASSAGSGAQIYDTTLGKPVWSDGTNWRDATGTVV